MIKSYVDDRKYRIIRLKNNIEAILVYDPDNTKSAASITIGAGSFEDTEDAPGLAHLTEHMMFSGSERFKDPSEFEDQLGFNYGSTNTFTEEEKTTFFFEVNWEGFEKGLYMFSRMFAEPLIKPDSIQRVLDNIQSEIESSKGKDQWREHQLIKTLASTVHPFSRFSLGDLQKLRKLDSNFLAGLVRNFYNKFYTPHNMKLVVSSSMNIESLESLVNSYFNDIRIDSVDEKQKDRYGEVANEAKAYTFDQLGQIVWYQKKPAHLTPTLDFIFVLDEVMSKSNVKPHDFITYILKYSGQGSLIHSLKKKNYAVKIDVGTIASFRTFSQLAISVYLTNKGLDNTQAVIDTTFSYLNLLRAKPSKFITNSIFDELKSIEENTFNFKAREESLSKFLTGISISMFDFSLKESLRNENFYKSFNATVIEGYVKALIPANVIIIVGSNKLNPNVKPLVSDNNQIQFLDNAQARKSNKMRNTNHFRNFKNHISTNSDFKREQHFNILYLNKKMSKEQINNLNNISQNLTIRGDNIYVSRDLNLVSCYGAGDKKELHKFLEKNRFNVTSKKKCEKEKAEIIPKLIKNNRKIKIWYKQDRSFLIPRVKVYLNILSNHLRNDVSKFANFNIFFEYLKLKIETKLSEAVNAGNEIKLEINENGIMVFINAYNDVIEGILDKILYFVFDKPDSKKTLTNKKLEEIISTAEERLRTSYHKTPLEAFRQIFNKIVKKGINSTDEARKEIVAKNITLMNFNNIIKEVREDLYIDALIYGNINDKVYLNLEKSFDKYIPNVPKTVANTESNLEAFKLIDSLHSHNFVDGSFVFKKFGENKNGNITTKTGKTAKEKNNYLLNYYQVGMRNVKNYLLMSLVEIAWGNMFNYQIRVLNKIGNVLSAKKEVIDNIMVINLFINF
jgi:secreted Zn-dependent insulinase-like peptidase